MLYIFHVDTGTMMTFDMNLALERVSSLQTAITNGCHIPEDKQVLLISGGESLDPNAVVGKYHAGTDTNPIYLFSKCTIESSIPPLPSVNYGSDLDLQGHLEGSLLMPPAYETIVSRAQLALQFHEVDTEELRACERLIHDQHLQQQGWAAVVANLEDVTSDLLHQSETFHVTFQNYLESRASYRELIARVNGSLQLLSKIPLILALAKSFDATASTSSNESLSSTTLFDWISSQDTNHTLRDMVEQCDKATEQLDVKVEEYFKSEIEQILREVQNESMKEVKGLEDRLYGLDQIIAEAKKLVQEQADLAQGFVQNQNRFGDVRDRSVLPDLCASHRNQLLEMLKNHNRLREIKKKCRLAKEELSVNLHTRLRWIMYVEKMILDVDGKLTIYLGNIRRIKKRLDILQQIKDAPWVYAQLLVEVVRRRNFSSKFLMWAGGIAENSLRLYTEEVKRRDTFLRIIGQHFLQSMFIGLEDCPPAFAIEPPELFDNNLPDVSAEDIKQLQAAVPELSEILSVPVDDDLFAISTVTNPKVLSTTAPGVGSEIEVLDECIQQYSIEGGIISLGDQFTACKKDANIVQRPMCISTVSPSDNFLLAKSLSKELTKEMNDVKKNINQGTKIKAQPVQTASTSISAIKHLMVSHGSKMSPPSTTETCYTPDMETSQEFATADFYFDESMPSSIESPPKCTSETKAKFEYKFLAEKESNTKLQKELQECSYKINHYEKILKHFKDLFDTALHDLKTIAKELKSQHCDHINVLMNEFECLRENMKRSLHSFDATISRSYGGVLDQMHSEQEKQIQELNNKIAVESSNSQEFEEKVKILCKELEERDKNHKKDIEKIMREKDDLGEKLAVEIADLTLKHELEIEVEVDKVKSEYLAKMTDFDTDLECKDKLISKMDSAIKNLQKEKIKIEEQLMDKFQNEKDKIFDILSDEFNEKLQKAVKEEKNKAEGMKQSIITELNEEHKNTEQKQLEELKQSLFVEKEQVVKNSESTLTLAQSKFAEEIKQRLLDKKSVEFRKLKEELENKFQADLANTNKEFGEEIKRLDAELKTFKDRQFTSSEMQTQQSVYNMMDYGTQACSNFIMVDAQVDTEILLHTSTSMQTEFQNCISFAAIQTDIQPVDNCSIQTENGHFTMDHSLQTNDIRICHLSIQTELPVGMSIQTETDETELLHVSLSEIGMQTDQWEVDLNSMTTSDGLDTETNLKLCLDFDKKIKELEDKHNNAINALTAQLEREKEESQQLKSSLTSLTGDKQIWFNEAVNKVCKEKDKLIDDLKRKEKELTDQLSILQEKSQAEDAVEKEKSNFKVRVKEFTARQHQSENDLGLAQQNLKQYKDKFQILTPEVRDSSSSTSFVQISDIEDSRLHKRINDLEKALKMKDEELSKIQQKMMELSMSASTRSLIQDKVSITNCHVGDLVLVCLDERLDQYVVYTIANTLHFLHTDCLVPLGLNPEAGKANRQWLIAEVIDKEYCEAKKASNRFNVPMGTRFYRVRAKKWNRENNPLAMKPSDTASSKVDTVTT